MSWKPYRSMGLVFVIVLSWTAMARGVQPTPHQILDQLLSPLTEEIQRLAPNAAETTIVSDIRARAELLAQQIMEARRHGSRSHELSLVRQLDWLVRLLRAQIERERATRALSEARATQDAVLNALQTVRDNLRTRVTVTPSPGAP